MNEEATSHQQLIWRILENHETPVGIWVDRLVIILIGLDLIIYVLETDSEFEAEYGDTFFWFDAFSVTIFTLEFVLRIYACPAVNKFASQYGRIRYLLTPYALMDFLAILPFFLHSFADIRFLRILRLLRIYRRFHYARAFDDLKSTLQEKSLEILKSLIVMICLLFVVSSMMYYAERNENPEAFGSILRVMSWAISTPFTAGFGGASPTSLLGQMLGSLVALLGIGVFAIPSGIVASAYLETRRNSPDQTLSTDESAEQQYKRERMHPSDSSKPNS
jgi:voltage-gated potassium channel